MSKNQDPESQAKAFAKAMEVAKISAKNHSGGVSQLLLKLENYEADEFFRRDLSSDSSFGGPNPSLPTLIEEGEIVKDELPVPYVSIDDPQDLDYKPAVEKKESPKPFSAMKLKSARKDTSGKRKERPFAPPERQPKKHNSSTSIGQIIEPHQKPRNVLTWHRRGHKQHARSDMDQLIYVHKLTIQCQRGHEKGDQKGDSKLQDLFQELRNRVAETGTYSFLSKTIVRDSKLLEQDGLPAIFNSDTFPEDIRADAMAQYSKWSAGICSPDLLHGIQCKSHTVGTKKGLTKYNLVPNYEFKVSAAYIGEGTLNNGQWWPLQICLIRDGAHGDIEAGISGKKGGVAYSVILSDSGYANIDKGKTVEYCGTSSHDNTPTANTKMLLESIKRQAPVRLIRSAGKKPTTYLPKKGLRYDGLYDVIKFVILDEDTAMHRFTLRRQPGQGAIRYAGNEARPNQHELDVYSRLRKDLGLTA